MNKIRTKIETTIPFLSATEQRLAYYILANSANVVNMSTKVLAEKSEVSEAAIIRFTKKIEVGGYKDLKIQLAADLATEESNSVVTDIKKNDSTYDIYNKLAAFTVESIQSTAQTLDSDALDAAVDLISNAARKNKRIYINGMGTSALLAKEFQVKLMRLDIPSIFYEDVHLRLESLTLMRKGDLFICFTALGKSTQNQQFLKLARDAGADVLLITQYGNQKLASLATVVLYTSITENNLRLMSQTSFTVQSIIIDTLFMGLASKHLAKVQNEVASTKQVFSKLGYYTE